MTKGCGWPGELMMREGGSADGDAIFAHDLLREEVDQERDERHEQQGELQSGQLRVAVWACDWQGIQPQQRVQQRENAGKVKQA